MRAGLLLTAALAVGVSAKRVYKTEYQVVTVTKTSTRTDNDAVPTVTSTRTRTAAAHTVQHAQVQHTDNAPTVETQTVTATNTQPAHHHAKHGHGKHRANNGPTVVTHYYTVNSNPTTLSTSTSTADNGDPTNAYQATVLHNHNIHRSNHSATSVSWSDDLEDSARILASRCVYKHDTSIAGGGYGQNIGYGVQAHQVGILITNLMYNDEMGYYSGLYGQANPSMSNFARWGHFSQIVWKDTQKVGCATVTCNSLANVYSSGPMPFTVCNYSPAGNYAGEYGKNVLPPMGHEMVVA